jgi:hypothetical protein
VKQLQRFLTLFITLLGLFSSSTVRAQSLTSESFDVRNRMENEIQKNLQSLISTQLDTKKFTVAVRAKVIPIPPPKDEKKKVEIETLPAGMDLGVIDVREILASYEKQLEELKIRQDLLKKDDTIKYQISSLEVVVGLDETYGDEYINKFSSWLKTKMKADYGATAKTVVNKLQLTTEKKVDEEKAAEQARKDEMNEKLKNFLLPIAIGLLALALIVAMMLVGRAIKSGLQQMALAQKNLAIEQKGEWLLSNAAGDEENVPESLPAAVSENMTPQLERLFDKIACICMEINGNLNDLARIWMDAGDHGYLKTALLIDTMVSAKERVMNDPSVTAIGRVRIPLDQDLMQSRSEGLTEAFKKMTEIEDKEKYDILEELYWDLVSVRTLGVQSLRVPFDFLQSMPKDNVISLLETQRDDTRALAVAYLPAATQNEVLNEYNEKNKSELIKNMLETSRIPEQQVWDVDTALKVVAINQGPGQKEKFVNLFPRTMEILQGLNQLEEIRILRKITPELPDQGSQLKKQHSTFAFIDQWKPEYIRKLTQVATADELQTLIRQIPTAQEILLSECAPKVRTIVEDDLRLTATVDDGATNTKLSSLRAKWNRLVVAESIPMSRVMNISTPNVEGVANAA